MSVNRQCNNINTVIRWTLKFSWRDLLLSEAFPLMSCLASGGLKGWCQMTATPPVIAEEDLLRYAKMLL